MNRRQLLELGRQLGLARDRTRLGLALRGTLDEAPVYVAQYEVPVGRDPRPRPFTELRVERAGASRGALFGASTGHTAATGDRPFDERFYWMPDPGMPDAPRPHYLGSPRLRQALLALDATIADAIGHKGIVVFQIDHFEDATRMMILTHLPQPALLERALRLLVELCALQQGAAPQSGTGLA
jgi:hypothetical protein